MNAANIKEFRKEKKMTQAQLGHLCGVSKAAVSNWESGRDKPSGAAKKILQSLASGNIQISKITDLEVKLLDQNVTTGNFKNREEYLTASLKHLLQHGTFLSIIEHHPYTSDSLVAAPSLEFNKEFNALKKNNQPRDDTKNEA